MSKGKDIRSVKGTCLEFLVAWVSGQVDTAKINKGRCTGIAIEGEAGTGSQRARMKLITVEDMDH